MRDEWEEAEKAANELAGSTDRTLKWSGLINLAICRLYHGLSREALALLDQSIVSQGKADANNAITNNYAARILLDKEQYDLALEHAQKAQRESDNDVAHWEGLSLEGLALAWLGRTKEANILAEELKRIADSLPTQKEVRRYHHLVGDIRAAQGDVTSAIQEFDTAQSMLPLGMRHYFLQHHPPPHVHIWYSLAHAHMEADKDHKAIEWFGRVAKSGAEHIWWPIPYVRSFYFLGKIHENRGEMDKAREYYRRFYEYWKDGDMDRERVEEARKKLAS